MRRAFALPVFFGVLAAAGCVEPECVECGLGAADQAVIGGMTTPSGTFPHVGALYEAGAAFCSGTLIAPDAVLTAAHCLEGRTSAPGFTLADDTRGAVEAYPGQSFVVHPMWDIDRAIADGPTQFFDLAIVKLADPVDIVTPAIIPSRVEAMGLLEGKRLTIVGYGQTIDGDAASAGIKHHAVAPIVNQSPSEMQLSDPGGPQNCYGDSGGPAFIDLGAGVRLAGVVSRGATTATTCDQGGIDTRVDFYADWIKQHVPNACTGGDACAGGGVPGPDVTGFGADIRGGCADVGGNGAASTTIAIALASVLGLRRRRGARTS